MKNHKNSPQHPTQKPANRTYTAGRSKGKPSLITVAKKSWKVAVKALKAVI
ncbi:MAG: hypothetical protein AAF617_04980 [Bacteroidota bacterium]